MFYAIVVLAISFRRGERWVWYSTRILVIGFAAPILVNQESCAAAYLIAAGLMGVCFLLTGPAFFRNVNLPKSENCNERNQVYGYSE
jgi:hypothetical protein